MARVRSKDSKAEMVVRRIVFALGYRYRLHGRTLPGQPDLVFRSRRKVIFVHGCFWHRHAGCALSRMPKSRLDFWGPKLNGNRERDIRTNEELVREGWGVLTIWECQLGETDCLQAKIKEFLDA
jgi:DNA mismatch endonuclease (patch repair protein)